MFVNEAAIDWLTLTTWSSMNWKDIEGICFGMGIAKPFEARRLQYRGLQAGGLFWGEGLQQGQKHYMVLASGMDAAIVAPRLAGLGMKCTRLDLQVTVKKPADWDASGLADVLRRYPPEAWHPAPKKRITVIQSGDGFDTLYIGERTSDRFYRLYVKPDDLGAAWLRFEVEYKRELAQELWNRIEGSRAPMQHMSGALWGEIEAIPGMRGILPESVQMALTPGRKPKTPPRTKVPSGSTGLAWLIRQVEPAILRLMADHDAGAGVRALIQGWAFEAKRIDDLWGGQDDDDIDAEPTIA